MLSIPKTRKKYIPLREFISDVVMSRGNRRFLLTNLQAQIWDVTLSISPIRGMYPDCPYYLHNQPSKWQGCVGHNPMDIPHRPDGVGRGWQSRYGVL
jgi:hypothetical protein